MMFFVCPYCVHYGSRSCHSGYGAISAKLARRGDGERFAGEFRKHIPVIVPIWFIPLVAGVVALVTHRFPWWLLALLVVFAVNSFAVLPLLSRRQGCADCPQKDSCPWMRL